jgi:hypothetical protein
MNPDFWLSTAIRTALNQKSGFIVITGFIVIISVKHFPLSGAGRLQRPETPKHFPNPIVS